MKIKKRRRKGGEKEEAGIMVLILDGNSEIGAHVGSNLRCLICLKHFIRLRAVTNQTCFPKCVRNMISELPSDILEPWHEEASLHR